MTDSQRLQDGLTGDPLLLTPEEAAKVLRIGRTTIYALMKAGELRPVHIGRSCRLSRAELERYVLRLETLRPGLRLDLADTAELPRTNAACSSSPPSRWSEPDLCIFQRVVSAHSATLDAGPGPAM